MNNKKHILSPTERRSIYVDYLKENQSASTSDFIKYLKKKYNADVSRQTICEDRKYLKKLGYEFTKPKKSTTKCMLKTDPDNAKVSCITQDLVMYWLLLGLADKTRPNISRDTLFSSYYEEPLIREQKISSYLKQLSKHNYLASAPDNSYRIRPAASSIYNFSSRQLMDFYENYQKLPVSGNAGSVIDPFYHFCNILLNETSKSSDISGYLFQHGRRNPAPDKLNEQLKKLGAFPYDTYQLNIVYHPRTLLPDCDCDLQHFRFSVALIFHNVETDQCYLLGQTEQKQTILCRLDRIDFDSTTSSTQHNTIYKSPQMRRIYDEMFSASLDELDNPVKVKVRFRLFSDNIYTKIKALQKHRSSTAHIDISEDEQYAYYTDTIIGLSAFTHYLRSFGPAAEVISPPELRDTMLSSAQKVYHIYTDHTTP